MQLEDYFDFETFETPHGPVERIRIKGHRISIEHVLEHYKAGASPETIVRDIYPTLNLEKVHATITYYLHNKDRVEDYIRKGDEIGEAYYQEWKRTHKPSPLELKFQRLRAGVTESHEEQVAGRPSPDLVLRNGGRVD